MNTYHDYKFKHKGKLIFDPEDMTKKHSKQSSWKKSAIVFLNDPDFCGYYSWFIKKRYNLDIMKPIRGVHFTVINDRVEDLKKYEEAKKIYNNTYVNLEYAVNPRTDGYHWYVAVKSPEAESIRVAAGFEAKPYFGFHITVGRADGELRLAHSTYIGGLIKKYGKEYL